MSSLGVQVFLGPDRARKLQRIQELERQLRVDPLDRHYVNAADTSAAELASLCRQRAAASPARLIVVDQAHQLPADCGQALLQHRAAIQQTACVVLLVDRDMSLRHPVARAAHEGGLAVTRFAGRDLPSAKPFALLDALGAGDLAGALQAVQDQLALGKEPLELVGLIAWQVQRWVSVRRLMDTGLSVDRIAAMTGMQRWQVERVRTEVAGRPLRQLQGLLQRCWQLDVDAKSGHTQPWLAIEQLLWELCAGYPRRGVTPGS